MYTEKQKERFFNKIKINEETGCHEWTACKSEEGYGHVNLNGKNKKAHRVAFEIYHDRNILDGMFICHKCDNPKCVNPNHLFEGSHQDNMDDMVKKERNKKRKFLHYGNKHAGKKVMAGFKIYDSYSEAGRAIGLSDNGVRKRVKAGREGYSELK